MCGKEPGASYCSGECQKLVCYPTLVLYFESISSTLQDWKRHKPFCEAGTVMSSVRSQSTDNKVPESSGQRTSPPEDIDLRDTFEGRAPGHSIDLSLGEGRTFLVSLKTMGPQMMRESRKMAEAHVGLD